MTEAPAGMDALTLAMVSGAVDGPSINSMRDAIGWASIVSRLCARMSISTPTTLPLPISCSREAWKIIEPPRATPVSTMTSGLVAQMTSWVAITSAGIWMIGTPIQDQRYE
ncbi:hypothetical protein D3C87_1785130 [compost metagenome]